MAVLGWGSSGPEVEDLQRRLKAAGFYFGTVDGRFGPQTFAAVKRFQQSAGLTVDGIAGPLTMQALTGAGGGQSPGGEPSGGGGAAGSAAAMSLHIGINRVDPAAYGGWDGALSGCEADARTMAAVAARHGYSARQLFSAQATSGAILGEIRRAAQSLTAGGTFLLTYAGHGGQVGDLTGTSDEVDLLDETWVAFDQQIIDDSLEAAFSEFATGVNIVMLSDSCHSGTVYRQSLSSFRGGEVKVSKEEQREMAGLKQSYYEHLSAPRSAPGGSMRSTFPRPVQAPDDLRTLGDSPPASEVVDVRATALVGGAASTSRVFGPPPLTDGDGSRGGGGGRNGGSGGGGPGGDGSGGDGSGAQSGYATRNMPLERNFEVNELQREALQAAKDEAGSRGKVRARGLLLSGCADNQLSQEIGGAGVFTTTMNRIWANGAFTGDYDALRSQVVAQMGPTQTPQLSAFGVDAHLLTAKTPFQP